LNQIIGGLVKKFRIKFVSILLVVCIMLLGLSGCYGKFKLTEKLYKWNGQIGDKWVNTMVMWVLFILPVYEVAGFIDFAILNVIEFWTGENPVVMGPDDKETQIVYIDDKEYEITATQNQFHIKELGENDPTKAISLIFDEKTRAWFVKGNETAEIKIAQLDDLNSNILHLIKPDGNMVDVNIQSNRLVSDLSIKKNY
jgi:hypothetical protein